MVRRRFLCVCAAALSAALDGCDPGAPRVDGTLEEVTVQGTVKVRGKPLSGGEVHFNPSNSRRRVGGRDAPIGKDGRYTVKTLRGQNVVSVTPPAAARTKAYFGLEYEEKALDIKPGETTIDLDFSP
jgi:hypothetical protein